MPLKFLHHSGFLEPACLNLQQLPWDVLEEEVTECEKEGLL